MNGELDFKASLKARVGLLKGLDVRVLEQVKEKISFTKGVERLCRVLKNRGVKMAVISGTPLSSFDE